MKSYLSSSKVEVSTFSEVRDFVYKHMILFSVVATLLFGREVDLGYCIR